MHQNSTHNALLQMYVLTSGRGVLAEHHGPVARPRRRPVGLVVAEVRHGAVLHAPPAHVDPVDAGRVPRLEDLPQHAWNQGYETWD